jgi:hypothetical protein
LSYSSSASAHGYCPRPFEFTKSAECFGHSYEVDSLTASDFGSFATNLQLPLGKLTYRLEEAAPCATTGFVHLHQRLVHQAVQRVEDDRRIEVSKRADGLRSFESPSIGEQGQPTKELALVGCQQLVTPADGRVERAVPRCRIGSPGCQKVQSSSQKPQQIAYR